MVNERTGGSGDEDVKFGGHDSRMSVVKICWIFS